VDSINLISYGLVAVTILGVIFLLVRINIPEVEDVIVVEQKNSCDIEDYSELQKRINKIKNDLEDLERPDLAPCEYEITDEKD